MRTILPALALALSLFPALTGPSASAAGATTTPALGVELLSPGAAPRAPLRLAVPDGTVAAATMEVSESIEQKTAGTTINSATTPPFRMAVQVTAGNAASNGNLPISYAYPTISVVDDGSVTADQLAQYRRALEPLTSLTATATMTPRNQIVDSKVAGTDGLEAAVAQLVTQVGDQLGSLSSPFPKEPVGVGAKWRTTAQLRLSGVDVRQVTSYTLSARDGNQLTVGIEVVQTAPRQRAELPGITKGTKVTLTRWRSTGSGQATLSLVQPALPVTSEIHTSGAQTFSVSEGGQRNSLDQTITAEMKLTP